jgi:hypothetical protein
VPTAKKNRELKTEIVPWSVDDKLGIIPIQHSESMNGSVSGTDTEAAPGVTNGTASNGVTTNGGLSNGITNGTKPNGVTNSTA